MQQSSGTPSGPNRSSDRGLYGQRPSASYDAIRRRQFERIASLSPLERMLEALEIDDETREILGEPRGEEACRRPPS
jgi:hypothetical protein